MRSLIEEAMCELKILAPEFVEKIYAEVKAEANTYTVQTGYDRLARAIRLIYRGIEPKVVLEMIKKQKDDLLEIMTDR